MQEMASAVKSIGKTMRKSTVQARMTTEQFRALQSKITGKKRGVMNKTEAAYVAEVLNARYLNNEIENWWYESFKLRLADGAWYTPDFAVLLHDGTWEMHEVKGFVREAAMVRIKVAAEKYPLRFFMCFKKKKRDGGGWFIKEMEHGGI